MNKIYITVLPVLILFVLQTEMFGQNSIVNTRHNLSVSGPGSLKSTEETEVCIFCHATHSGSGQAPLWNRYESSVTYSIYGSPTMQSGTQQPQFNSRLCLSCHDGTVAMGLIRNREEAIPFSVGMDKIPPERRTNLSDDLSNDHPLNLDFNPHPEGEFTCGGCHSDHGPLTSLNLNCSSCHNPHNDINGKFLITNPIGGGICLRCHERTGWSIGSHKLSSVPWNGTPPDPWPYTEWTTVSENACNNCHNSHGNPAQYWLLKFNAKEDNCYVCHNGNVAGSNITGDMLKTSQHPVGDYNGVHLPNEDPIIMERHVECTDCHNSHQANGSNAVAPNITGALKGVSGVDEAGTPIDNVLYEYEVCYKCHQNSTLSTQYHVNRVDAQSSIRLEFSPVNPSYHPVVNQGHNINVPSLLSPFTVNSILYCTDCHNNDDAGNSWAANGPHGSNFAPILRDQMIYTDYNSESSSIYALCYQCHDRNSILNDESFEKHKEHIDGEKTSCTTCHDPHGSYNNSHLLNFNRDYVFANSEGRLEFIDNGVFAGECYLTCHNKDHNPKDYGSRVIR